MPNAVSGCIAYATGTVGGHGDVHQLWIIEFKPVHQFDVGLLVSDLQPRVMALFLVNGAYRHAIVVVGRIHPGVFRERQQFADTVIDQIANYSPNFRSLILHYEIRTPADIEEQIGITEGNIFHGELTMDQLLFNRPVPGYAQYRSPVGGLYMCGSSTHPGGGVMAAPGANAAREILADLKRDNTVPETFGDD